jgi:hypothetical protein
MDAFLTRALLKIRDETRARGDTSKNAKRLVDGCSEALGQALGVWGSGAGLAVHKWRCSHGLWHIPYMHRCNQGDPERAERVQGAHYKCLPGVPFPSRLSVSLTKSDAIFSRRPSLQYFDVLRLACESQHAASTTVALDCIQKLIA